MLTFVLLAALMCIVTLVLLTRPLWPSFASGSVHHVGDEVARLGQQNKQLRELHAAGALTDEAFASAKALVETKLLATVLDANPSATLARRSTSALGGAMVVFVAAVVGAGYYGLGSPASLALGPDSSLSGASRDEAARGGDAEVEGAAHPITTEQITSMVEKLAERLKQQPDDGDGWFMLARSYAAIGKHPEAVDAFTQAARLLPEDASLLNDMITKHYAYTGSTVARFVLDDFENQLKNFVKVFPKDYKKVLSEKKKQKVEAGK